MHIQVLENIATLQCLQTFSHLVPLHNLTILILTDNMASAYYIAHEGGTKSRDLSLVAEHLLQWTRQKGIHLFVEHIPGVKNTIAVSILVQSKSLPKFNYMFFCALLPVLQDLDSRRALDVHSWMLNL